uniref:Torsin-1A-like n=1 Tax=Phallusia mammillata TaxID=59560 RepID=A0A6F9DEZ4_9ASCI|nr:torsin-1A-like [Phallusia mammillata]
MHPNLLGIVVLLTTTCLSGGVCFELISITTVVATAATSAVVMLAEKTGLTSFRCGWLIECCASPTVHLNESGLFTDLNQNLHGQHLVTSTVYKAVKSHMRNKEPSKPLVMSFHGWTGGGKNFVARMIINNIYAKGEKSSFVHVFNAEVEFKHTRHLEQYKDNLQNWLHGNVSKCGRSIFVFDEMDHMPSGLIDAVKPYLGNEAAIRGVDYRKSIFIFLSNTGGQEIVAKCKSEWERGMKREGLRLSDMQDILEKSAYNQLSGFHRSGIIERNLIDHFVPFLPLERQHVRSCIEDEIKRRGINTESTTMQENIEEILDQLLWLPEKSRLYSKSGCKRIANKVGLVLEN